MTVADHVSLEDLSATIIQSGSKSFAAASKLFDRETRASAHLLYAWCRHCDDVIDGQELGHRPEAPAADRDRGCDRDRQATALAELRQQTADALAGKTMADPVFQAFQRVALRHAIPPAHPFALLDGFAMDVAGRRYETLEDTLDYCYHVAGVVGVMMGHVMGIRDDAVLDRASDLGIGFQLTNVSRDVIDDASIGRVYLPQAWLREAGVAPDEMTAPHARPAVAAVVGRLLGEADRYYASSLAGLSELPLRSAWAVATARTVYARIGREVEKRGINAWESRVSTSTAQKLVAVGRGAARAIGSRLARERTPQTRDGLWTRPR